nr:MAG TPA: hypothetical protein [Caudoviricetes sp.]DAT69753.1 MAG TPA: hypothetical protein [Caudoviricetes sp.]
MLIGFLTVVLRSDMQNYKMVNVYQRCASNE